MPTPTSAPGNAQQQLSDRPSFWSPGATLGVPRPPASWGASPGLAETQATDSEEENTEERESQQRKEVQQTQDEEEEDEEDGMDDGLIPTHAEVRSTARNALCAEAAALEQHQATGCTAAAMSLASVQQMQEGEGKQEEEEEEEDEDEDEEEEEADKESKEDEVLPSGNIVTRSTADVHNFKPVQLTSRTAENLSMPSVEQAQEEGEKAEEEKEDVEDDEVMIHENTETRSSVQQDSVTGSTAAAMSLADVLIAAAQGDGQGPSPGSEANDCPGACSENQTGDQLKSLLSRVPASTSIADDERVNCGGSVEDHAADDLRESTTAATLRCDHVPVVPRRIRLSTKSPGTLFRPIATPIRQERNRQLTEGATSRDAVRTAASAGSHTSSPCGVTSAASASKREKDCKPGSQTSAAASIVDIQLSKSGHTLQPAQQGQRVHVRGDGWGNSGPGFEAIVTESDNCTFTVIVVSGADAWKETHVLQEHCRPVVEDSSSPVASHVAKKRRVSAGQV